MYFYSVLFLISSLLFFQTNLKAQEKSCSYTLKGVIYGENKNKLELASIYIQETKQGVASNQSGKYTIDDLCAGTYKISCYLMSYMQIDTLITIPYKKALNFNLHLSSGINLDEVVVEEKKVEERIAQTIQIIQAKELDVQKGKTLGEVLSVMPGVSTLNTGGRVFKPMIHGLHSNRIFHSCCFR